MSGVPPGFFRASLSRANALRGRVRASLSHNAPTTQDAGQLGPEHQPAPDSWGGRAHARSRRNRFGAKLRRSALFVRRTMSCRNPRPCLKLPMLLVDNPWDDRAFGGERAASLRRGEDNLAILGHSVSIPQNDGQHEGHHRNRDVVRGSCRMTVHAASAASRALAVPGAVALPDVAADLPGPERASDGANVDIWMQEDVGLLHFVDQGVNDHSSDWSSSRGSFESDDGATYAFAAAWERQGADTSNGSWWSARADVRAAQFGRGWGGQRAESNVIIEEMDDADDVIGRKNKKTAKPFMLSSAATNATAGLTVIAAAVAAAAVTAAAETLAGDYPTSAASSDLAERLSSAGMTVLAVLLLAVLLMTASRHMTRQASA